MDFLHQRKRAILHPYLEVYGFSLEGDMVADHPKHIGHAKVLAGGHLDPIAAKRFADEQVFNREMHPEFFVHRRNQLINRGGNLIGRVERLLLILERQSLSVVVEAPGGFHIPDIQAKTIGPAQLHIRQSRELKASLLHFQFLPHLHGYAKLFGIGKKIRGPLHDLDRLGIDCFGNRIRSLGR